jgi:hypothetical protein
MREMHFDDQSSADHFRLPAENKCRYVLLGILRRECVKQTADPTQGPVHSQLLLQSYASCQPSCPVRPSRPQGHPPCVQRVKLVFGSLPC